MHFLLNSSNVRVYFKHFIYLTLNVLAWTIVFNRTPNVDDAEVAINLVKNAGSKSRSPGYDLSEITNHIAPDDQMTIHADRLNSFA